MNPERCDGTTADTLKEESTQALIDEIRDRMAGVAPSERCDLAMKVLDGYLDAQEPLYGALWDITH